MLAWRWLRRMRTALYLLGVLGVLSIIATVVPQRPNVPQTVAAWQDGTEGPGTFVSGLIDAVGAYDVYGSRPFLAVLVLLFTSLTACLIPRYRALWRLRRAVPPRSRDLSVHPEQAEVDTGRDVAGALDVAREVLSERRWDLRPDEPEQVAAERGLMIREAGSLLFHTSFYVLLIAIVAGQLVGFSGQVAIVEGEQWADGPVGYWTYRPGQLWSEADHRGFVLELEQFEVEWTDDAQPILFRSTVNVTEADGDTYTDTVGSNDPLLIDGMKVLQLDWGYAARVVVADGSEVVHDALVPMTATETAGLWHGAVKAPALEPDLGLDLLFLASAPEGPNGPEPTGAPWLEEPALLFDVYRGDLRFDRVQNINTLDTTAMDLVASTYLRDGEALDLGEGVTVAFPEIRRWVAFQISDRPTAPLLLAAAGLILLGLIPALYAYRRRLWVTATLDPDRGTTVLRVAGRSFQRPEAFSDEFHDIVEELRRRLGPVDAGDPDHRPERPSEVGAR